MTYHLPSTTTDHGTASPELHTVFDDVSGFEYRSLGTLFREAAQRAPEAIALECGELRLSYREMQAQVAACAASLRQLQLRPGDLVGVHLERSERYVILAMALMTSGLVYLPLSVDLPAERLRLMAQIARPALIVSDADVGVWEGVRQQASEALFAGGTTSEVPDSADVAIPPTAPAYVIFTSGSTGQPKGVVIHHEGFVNRLLWARRYYGLDAKDVIYGRTALSFDPSIQELVLPFIAGCRLLVARSAALALPNHLIASLEASRATMLIVVPSLLRQLLQSPAFARCHALRHVVCCGEPWGSDLITAFHRSLPGADIYNGYGPTETTIGTLVYRPARGHDADFIPIGRPISNVHIALLDESQRSVPRGEVGELAIGGVCVGQGYIGNEAATREKFRTLPVAGFGPVRFYLTGDLARELPDGNILFCGRKDNQVKIHGVRVELEEIETVLKQLTGVEDAIVVKAGHDDGASLQAFIKVDADHFDAKALASHCRSRLNPQVVPSLFHRVDAFPLLPNGKVDRKGVAQLHRAPKAEGAP